MRANLFLGQSEKWRDNASRSRSAEEKIGVEQRDASPKWGSTRSRFCLSLWSGPWSRIRSRVRSSNNSSCTSPRLVSYFSKVFKPASTQTVTELHVGKDEGRRTMLHLPLPMRRNNRDHRQEMGALRTSSARKPWDAPLQQARRKTSGNKCKDPNRSSKESSANRTS